MTSRKHRSGWRIAGALWLAMAGVSLIAWPGYALGQAAQLKPEEQAAQMLNGANKAFNDKQYPQAADRYREYLKTFAGMKEASFARYGLALCLFEVNPKDYKQATDLLGQVVGVQDFAERPVALYYLALAPQSGAGRAESGRRQAQ